jgi:phenylacetate-CoA ligase
LNSLCEKVRDAVLLARHGKLQPRDLRAFQDRRLRALVRHAYERVPFYRSLYDAHGVDVDSIRTVDDLGRLPLTNKQMFQALPMEQRLARGIDHRRLIFRKTSGSSGQPFVFARSLMEERFLGGVRIRAMLALGSRPSHCHVSVLINHQKQKADKQLPLGPLRAMGFMRGGLIDCLQEPQVIFEALQRAKPDVIISFPGILSRVGALAQSERNSRVQPRMIFCGGEVVTPLMRKQIEAGFAAPLYDTYGSVEFNLIASQCPQGNSMHTCDYSVIHEILNGETPTPIGQRGEMVVTGLHSFAMPLIRYRIGDIATRGSAGCACGSHFGTINAIEGRMTDHFQLPGSRTVHPWKIVTAVLTDPKMVREFQLLQQTRSRVAMRIVPQRPISESELDVIRSGAQRILGDDVTVDVQLVDRIPLEASGKFRPTRSLVQSEYDNVAWSAKAS